MFRAFRKSESLCAFFVGENGLLTLKNGAIQEVDSVQILLFGKIATERYSKTFFSWVLLYISGGSGKRRTSHRDVIGYVGHSDWMTLFGLFVLLLERIRQRQPPDAGLLKIEDSVQIWLFIAVKLLSRRYYQLLAHITSRNSPAKGGGEVSVKVGGGCRS